jgi:hypothetical protein
VSVTVTPQQFKYVWYDAATIQRVADGLVAALHLGGRPVEVHVDETTPLARLTIEIGAGAADPVVLRVESGAFEDTRRPRQLSEEATAIALGRALLRVHDRLSGGFGEAPDDDDLSLAQVAAWEVYCVGRLERVGVHSNQQRWRYNFRNRHGFSDSSDAAFDQIWSSDGLTWGELNALSASA